MPSVMRIHRGIALREQGFRCFYCKAPLTTRTATGDHMHPKSRRGRLNGNIVASCKSCNEAKGNLFSQQFFTLINKAKPPKGAEPAILLVWATRRIWRRTHKACERIERFAQPQPISANP